MMIPTPAASECVNPLKSVDTNGGVCDARTHECAWGEGRVRYRRPWKSGMQDSTNLSGSPEMLMHHIRRCCPTQAGDMTPYLSCKGDQLERLCSMVPPSHENL